MECIECEADDATLVEVEYTDGRGEEITLCNECRDEYEEGGLVQTTSLVKP